MGLLPSRPMDATTVQAIAAVASVVLAIVIAFLTFRLTTATENYAKSADDQVKELVEGRLAAIAPFLHVTRILVEKGDPQTLVGIIVRVEFLNLGLGPALSVRAHARHPWVVLRTADDLRSICTRDDTAAASLFAGKADNERGNSEGQGPAEEVRVMLEYRDLAGYWWSTTVRARGRYELSVDREVLDGQLVVLDQSERVERIKQPRILASDWRTGREPVWSLPPGSE